MKLHTNFWFLKDKKVMQPGKILIFGKKSEISLRVQPFGVDKTFFTLMQGFPNNSKGWEKVDFPQWGGENKTFYRGEGG